MRNRAMLHAWHYLQSRKLHMDQCHGDLLHRVDKLLVEVGHPGRVRKCTRGRDVEVDDNATERNLTYWLTCRPCCQMLKTWMRLRDAQQQNAINATKWWCCNGIWRQTGVAGTCKAGEGAWASAGGSGSKSYLALHGQRVLYR
jgi:hypothetical protein